MSEDVDPSGPDASRFIQFFKQNDWHLAAKKRHAGGLAKLSGKEIARLEAAVRTAFFVTSEGGRLRFRYSFASSRTSASMNSSGVSAL